MKKLIKAVLIGSLMGPCLSSCSLVFTKPDDLNLQERMAMIPDGRAPIETKTQIYWDEHSIPFIETASDNDAAFALGMIQAHLRLGQLELLRLLSQGRISEVAGPIPFVKTLDQGLRMLNFRQAADTTIKALPQSTLIWLQHFTRGINWYIQHLKVKPVEHRMLQLALSEFTVSDVLTIGKLTSADLTWAVYARFLKLAEQQDWQEALALFVDKQKFDSASFETSPQPELIRLIHDMTRSGSNSVVIDGKRSRSGSAMIANDPHVGLFLPNFWLLAGVKSPSYHMVGFMLPGVPFIALGRNPEVAWGGTNMRAISTHLFDVSKLPASEITSRQEQIKRRWWFDTEVTIRETSFGPIFTDLDYFDAEKQPFTAALQWIGQEPSDEIGSFLAANRAQNWDQFVEAFANYRVSAMNILYADRSGNIGMLPAYGQPVLKDPQQTLSLVKDRNNPIKGILGPTDLPRSKNPPSGIIASANNKPFAQHPIPLAFGYANNDRHDRMIELLGNNSSIQRVDLEALQKDVYSRSAFELKQALNLGLGTYSGEPQAMFHKTFVDWDGNYHLASRGAVAFEILMSMAWADYIAVFPKSGATHDMLKAYDGWKDLLTTWVKEQPQEQLQASMSRWLKQGEASFARVLNWEQFHQQVMQHPFGNLPLIGKRFRALSYGESGGNDTLFKSGRPLSSEPAQVTYGASARHISDLSDPNANYFVLKGGQDGWLNSPQLSDQLELWRAGKYLQIPLSLKLVKEQFRSHTTVLVPE